VHDHHDRLTILMMGNPNVGKSALFNRLTGANAVVSNYPGTTVDVTKGYLRKDRHSYEIIDVPGAYSLEARDAAEEVAVRILDTHPDAVIMVVLDATRVERGLYLALEVIERGAPCILALNMMDVAQDKQIAVDAAEMQRVLGIPVVATTAISAEGVKHLADMIRKAQVADLSAIRSRLNGQEPDQGAVARCAGCGGGGCR